MHAAWRYAFDAHLAKLSRAVLTPPIVHGDASATSVVVVCPPWRYPPGEFAREVHAQLRNATVVTLVPPFEHPEGGYEWWAYLDDTDAPSTSRPSMASLHLTANDREVAAALAAVRTFVTLLGRAKKDVALFGSSQGGCVAAHVGVECDTPRLTRVAAYQPAGFYVEHWRPRRDVRFKVALDDATHGDLSAWRGRLGPRSRNRTVTLFFGRSDTVAPAGLLRLVRQSDHTTKPATTEAMAPSTSRRSAERTVTRVPSVGSVGSDTEAHGQTHT